MKIMKVVYTAECSTSDWDGSNSKNYMGEESWSIGEKFNGEFIQGEISHIIQGDLSIDILVAPPDRTPLPAISIPLHAVQRIYYGEE